MVETYSELMQALEKKYNEYQSQEGMGHKSNKIYEIKENLVSLVQSEKMQPLILESPPVLRDLFLRVSKFVAEYEYFQEKFDLSIDENGFLKIHQVLPPTPDFNGRKGRKDSEITNVTYGIDKNNSKAVVIESEEIDINTLNQEQSNVAMTFNREMYTEGLQTQQTIAKQTVDVANNSNLNDIIISYRPDDTGVQPKGNQSVRYYDESTYIRRGMSYLDFENIGVVETKKYKAGKVIEQSFQRADVTNGGPFLITSGDGIVVTYSESGDIEKITQDGNPVEIDDENKSSDKVARDLAVKTYGGTETWRYLAESSNENISKQLREFARKKVAQIENNRNNAKYTVTPEDIKNLTNQVRIGRVDEQAATIGKNINPHNLEGNQH